MSVPKTAFSFIKIFSVTGHSWTTQDVVTKTKTKRGWVQNDKENMDMGTMNQIHEKNHNCVPPFKSLHDTLTLLPVAKAT